MSSDSTPRVFISYAHDSDEHREGVLRFASFLRAQGIDAVLDTWCEGESQDWYAWAIRELTGADYVLVVASPRYRQVGDGCGPQGMHRGVQSEAALLRELIYGNRDRWRQRILPVLLDGHGPDEIPLFLQPHSASRYTVRAFTVADAAPLLRVLLRRPVHVPPPVALPPVVTPAEWGEIPLSVEEINTVAWARLPGAALESDSRGPVPRQLPVRHGQFVGRQSELDQLATLLGVAAPASGTVVITAIAGTAGIGKTALAMHWAHHIADRFPDGQLHVNLRGFDPQAPVEPSQALHGFLEALGVVPSGIPSDLDARAALYRSLVADRRLLIMLDNAATADQVRPLLPNAPTCLVIVTSRNDLEGLIVREGANRIALDVLTDSDARDLLAQRIGPDRLAAEPEAASALIDLCARLPLALSIVAARAANHPFASLVRQLGDERNRLDVLNLGDPDLDIRAVFSWSYRVLSPEAARLFRLLGLHPGPDIDHHVCAVLMDRAPITELTTANLLDEYRPDRFRFHDLLRTYAAECAARDEPPSERLTAIRHMIDYYLATATFADFRIMPCRDGLVRTEPVSAGLPVISTVSDAMDWFIAENDTLLAMIKLAIEHGFDAHVDQLAWACDTFLGRAGQRHERVAVNRLALDAARRSADLAAQIRNLWSLSRTIARMGNFAEAAECLAEATDLNQTLGDEYHQIAIHLAYVQLLDIQKRHAEAINPAQRALDLVQHTPSQMYLADALTAVSWDQAWLGRGVEVLSSCERALEIYSGIGHPEGNAYALHALGFIHQELGDHAQAIRCWKRSIEINRELGARYWEAVVLDHLGGAYHALGDRRRAQLTWRRAFDILDTLCHPDAEAIKEKCVEWQGQATGRFLDLAKQLDSP